METLLIAIRDTLQAQMTGYRDGDIYITPDTGFIPQGVKTPCIGIKDGGEVCRYQPGHGKDVSMTVWLVFIHDLSAREAAIIGNLQTGRKGVLQAKAEAVAFLEGNDLGIAGMQREVRVVKDPESEFYLTKKNEMYQRKLVALQYEKEE